MLKRRFYLLPGLAVLVLDRVVKYACDGMNMPLIPGVIALRSVHNSGMAMGMLQGQAGWILALSAGLAGLCLYLLRDVRPSGWGAFGLSLLAGGAIGNLIDRVALGYVIDMFELLFMDFYIFNVADAGVVAGAVLCGWSLLFRPQDWSKKEQ